MQLLLWWRWREKELKERGDSARRLKNGKAFVRTIRHETHENLIPVLLSWREKIWHFLCILIHTYLASCSQAVIKVTNVVISLGGKVIRQHCTKRWHFRFGRMFRTKELFEKYNSHLFGGSCSCWAWYFLRACFLCKSKAFGIVSPGT